MRVLYDHQIFHRQKHGGISRYFFELLTRAVRHADIDVSLFAGFHQSASDLASLGPHCARFFARRRGQGAFRSKTSGALNRLLFPIVARTGAADIYHQTYYEPLAKGFNGARVVTVYDMIHDLYPQHVRADDATSAMRRACVPLTDRFIAISHATKKDFVEILGVPEEKVAVVHLAGSLNVRAGEPPGVDGPYLLYVGTRAAYKNFDLLIRAFSVAEELGGVKLVCFGGGPMAEVHSSLIASCGVAGRVVHMTGGDRLLARLYAHAAAFVYPSLYEGFGIPPLEAMHYGCPVVVSRSSSIPEVVGEAGLYFDPKDRDELAAVLTRVVGDSALRAELADKGRAREKEFSWERMFEETLAVYRELG